MIKSVTRRISVESKRVLEVIAINYRPGVITIYSLAE
jgi:hypothetical protein